MLSTLVERGLQGDALKRAYANLDRLHRVVHSHNLINYYEEENQDVERVLNIFIRLNSGGTVLSYSDLLLSIAVAQWKQDARAAIHKLVDDLNRIGTGFALSQDFVLKAGLMLADIASVGFKVENFTITFQPACITAASRTSKVIPIERLKGTGTNPRGRAGRCPQLARRGSTSDASAPSTRWRSGSSAGVGSRRAARTGEST